MYTIPFRIRGIGEHALLRHLKSRQTQRKIWTCSFFSNHLMSTDTALLLFSFIMQTHISSQRNKHLFRGKKVRVFFCSPCNQGRFLLLSAQIVRGCKYHTLEKKPQLTDSLNMFFPHAIFNREALRLETTLSQCCNSFCQQLFAAAKVFPSAANSDS